MKPVLTTSEMAGVDAAARDRVGIDALIERAGRSIFSRSRMLLGHTYGRRVIVVAGKGHNGDDGRVAARLLRERGASVLVAAPGELGPSLPDCDLVIDSAYGTGFRGVYEAPNAPRGAIVLAVDVPSGLDADTGVACETAVRADRTVTFGALKPGLLFGDGPSCSGVVDVDQIGLDLGEHTLGLVEESDVTDALPPRARDAHKWNAAVFIAAGSPLMSGAAYLASSAALRSGAGMVRLGVPGTVGSQRPIEVVSIELGGSEFEHDVLRELARCRALVVGPGLGREEATLASVRALVSRTPVPIVVDADGLFALGRIERHLRDDDTAIVLTPHDGEFERLVGQAPGVDRLGAARALAHRAGATVLLKGPATIVASPTGEAVIANAGGPTLASAGTGDVLSGVIGAFIARGLSPLVAAATAAYVHGRASRIGPAQGLVASDLPGLVSTVLSQLERHG